MSIVSTAKTCTHCRQRLPIEEFHRNPRSSDGRASWCADCTRTTLRERRRESKPQMRPYRPHKPVVRAEGAKSCAKCGVMKPLDEYHRSANRPDGRVSRCKPCVSEYAKARNAGNLRQRRERARRRLYGIEPLDFERLWTEQGGRCAGCGVTLDESAHVDHDHDSGVVRGLLCAGCNLALGWMSESPHRLRALADYAAQWGGEDG